MKNELGEIFYDGKIINLKSADEIQLQDLLIKVRSEKLDTKEKLETVIEQMCNI